MEHIRTNVISASFSRTQDLAMSVLQALGGAEIGYSTLACAMLIGRLSNPETKLEPPAEIQFIESLMDFVDAYWADGKDAN